MVMPIQYSWDNIIRGILDASASAQIVYPTDTSVITLTSGTGANTLGSFSSDIIPAGDITSPFGIHQIDIGNPSNNANYTIVLYAGSSDTEISRVCFQRFNATNTSDTKPVRSEILAPSSRVRAKMMDSVGGYTVDVKLYIHLYDNVYEL